jgi:hypothetical protein
MESRRWYGLDNDGNVIVEWAGHIEDDRWRVDDEVIPPPITREELLVRPGGADALAQWNAGDDSAHQGYEDRVIREVHESSLIEEAEFAAEEARTRLRSV